MLLLLLLPTPCLLAPVARFFKPKSSGREPAGGGCRWTRARTRRCASQTVYQLGKVSIVPGVVVYPLTNLAGSLNLAELDKGVASLGEGSRDGGSGLGLTLGADNGSLALLLSLLDDELGTLGILLGNLLLLDGGGELLAEAAGSVSRSGRGQSTYVMWV